MPPFVECAILIKANVIALHSMRDYPIFINYIVHLEFRNAPATGSLVISVAKERFGCCWRLRPQTTPEKA